MEYLRHRHGEECHRNAARLCSLAHSLRIEGVKRHLAAHRHIAYEICRERQERYEYALIYKVKAETAGEDTLVLRPRAFFHYILFSRLHAEGERREAVGYKVYPQKMRGFKHREAYYRRREYRHDLRHIGGKQELYSLSYIRVYPAPLLHGVYYRREVVVAEYHIRDVFCDVGYGYTHSDAYIGGLYRRRVVYTVAGHGGYLSALFPRGDYLHLVLRLYPRIDRVVVHRAGKLLVRQAVELRPGYSLRRVGNYAELHSYRNGGVLMVSCYHYRAYSGCATLRNRGEHLRAYRVYHSAKTYEYKVVLKPLCGILRGLAGEGTVSRRQNAERLVSHSLICRRYRLAVLLCNVSYAVLCQYPCTTAEHLVRRALRVLNISVLTAMNGGHHLTHRVKRHLADAREPCLRLCLFHSALRREVDQRALCGLAYRGSGLVRRGV